MSESRRQFLKRSAATAAGVVVAPCFAFGAVGVTRPMRRVLGRTGLEVTTFGLGGQETARRWLDEMTRRREASEQASPSAAMAETTDPAAAEDGTAR